MITHTQNELAPSNIDEESQNNENRFRSGELEILSICRPDLKPAIMDISQKEEDQFKLQIDNCKKPNSNYSVDDGKYEHSVQMSALVLAKMEELWKTVLSNIGLNLRVLIEPRGFIRIIQLIMAIFAFAMTVGYKNVEEFLITCRVFEIERLYKFGYPFKMERYEVRVPERCSNTSDIHFKSYYLSFDFSSNAEFFVGVGVLTLIYTVIVIFVYVIMHRLYSSNPIIVALDLMVTIVLSIYWFAGSCVWAQAVSDIKYHTYPANLFQIIDICKQPKVCSASSQGNFDYLYASLIFGFASCVLWIFSIWFIYKATSFHKQKIPSSGMMPPQMGKQEKAPPMQEKYLKY